MKLVKEDIEDEIVTQKPQSDDGVPVFWKVFGGSVFSIIVFLILAICGYIINNINNIQSQVSVLASQTIQKQEFEGRAKTIEELRDKIAVIAEQQADMEEKLTKLENLTAQEFKAVQESAKDFHATKERIAGMERRFEEIKEIREKIEIMREKIASLQTKTEVVPPAIQPPTQPQLEPGKD